MEDGRGRDLISIIELLKLSSSRPDFRSADFIVFIARRRCLNYASFKLKLLLQDAGIEILLFRLGAICFFFLIYVSMGMDIHTDMFGHRVQIIRCFIEIGKKLKRNHSIIEWLVMCIYNFCIIIYIFLIFIKYSQVISDERELPRHVKILFL